MFHCVQKCNLIFSPVETYLNPQRSSRRLPSWIFIRNILFILPLGAEWMEWHSVHSGIGMRNRKTRAFYILAILIPELWIKKRALSFTRVALFTANIVQVTKRPNMKFIVYHKNRCADSKYWAFINWNRRILLRIWFTWKLKLKVRNNTSHFRSRTHSKAGTILIINTRNQRKCYLT